MSTFNKVFCESIFEKGIRINPESLKGDPGTVTSTGGEKGDQGPDGNFSIETWYLPPNAAQTVWTLPNPTEVLYDSYRIVKPYISRDNITIYNHLDVKIATLYKDQIQELTVYKRINEWVF
jgi:hypothetical protein